MTQDLNKIRERVEKIIEAKANSTKVNAWYSHNGDGSIRGPFCRWLRVSGVAPAYKNQVASQEDDAKFFALVANESEFLTKHFLAMLDTLIDISTLHGKTTLQGFQSGIDQKMADEVLTALAKDTP